MKSKFLPVLFFMLACFAANAQTNNLIIFDQEGHPFYAILNGVTQNAAPQTNVKITGLTSTMYKLRLIFKDSTLPLIDKTVGFQGMGYEETYHVVTKNNGERVIRIEAVDQIPASPSPSAPNQNVIVYSNTPPAPPQPVSSTTVVKQTTTTTTIPDGITNVNVSVNGMNTGMNVSGINQTTTTTTTTTIDDGGINQSQPPPPPAPVQYVPGYTGPIGCPVPMSHDDYESAKNSISQKDFENTKLDMAKEIVGSNCLLAEQVRGIMKLFSFENSKLEFAKFAYTHTYDKGNYFKVNDAFDFDSSSSELNNYISGK